MIRFGNVFKHYQAGNKVVTGLDDVSLEINKPGLYLITGESGSGKSTFLNIISGFDFPTSGSYLFKEKDTDLFSEEEWDSFRKNEVSFINQNFNLISEYSVKDNIEAASYLFEGDKRKRVIRIQQILRQLGISSILKKKVKNLSGGQKQRVAIARCLVKNTPIILADEPTGSLDLRNSKEIAKILKEISKDKIVLVVTHNEDLFEEIADYKIVLKDGKIINDFKKQKQEKEKVKINDNVIKEKKRVYGIAKNPLFLLMFFLLPFLSLFLIQSLYSGAISSINADKSVIYDTEAYRNITEDRYIVTKNDGSFFNDEDYEYFKNNKGFKSIFKQDILLDMAGSSTTKYEKYSSKDINTFYIRSCTELEKLYKGNIPTKDSQIVYETDFFENVYDKTSEQIWINENRKYDVECVGQAAAERRGMYNTYYFTEEMIEQLYADYSTMFHIHLFETEERTVSGSTIILSPLIESGKIMTNNQDLIGKEVNFKINTGYDTITIDKFECYTDTNNAIFYEHSGNENIVVINDKDYQKYVNGHYRQITVFSSEQIKNNGKYNIFYPAEIGKGYNFSETILKGILYIALTLILGTGLTILSYFLLKKISSSEVYSLTVFKTIGYSDKDLILKTGIRNLIPNLISYILTVLLFILFDYVHKRAKAEGDEILAAIFPSGMPKVQIIIIPLIYFLFLFIAVSNYQYKKFKSTKLILNEKND